MVKKTKKKKGTTSRVPDVEHLAEANMRLKALLGGDFSDAQTIDVALLTLCDKLAMRLIPADRVSRLIEQRAADIVSGLMVAWIQRHRPELDGAEVFVVYHPSGKIDLRVGDEEPLSCILAGHSDKSIKEEVQR